MSKQTRQISAEPHPGLEPNEVLVVDIGYDKGGTNYFSGVMNERRGYWLFVRPEKRENGMRSFTMFEGAKAFLKEAKRFSEKELAAIVPDPELILKLSVKVLAERANKVAAKAARG